MTRKQFTLLFIRNDAHVRRFGLSRTGVVLVAITACLVIAAAVLGSYAGYVFWERYRDLRKVHTTVRRQLDRNEEKLQRLRNLEAFMHSLEPDRLESILDLSNTHNSSTDHWSEKDDVASTSTRNFSLSRIELRRTGPGRLGLQVEITNRSTVAEGVLEIELLMKNGRAIGLDSDLLSGELSFNTTSSQLVQVSFPGPDQPGTEISALLLTVRGPDGAVLSRKSYPLASVLR
jgi:hypothetical protein